MKIFKKSYTWLAKKFTKCTPVQAYCAVGLTGGDEIVITLDAKNPDDMVKILYVVFSSVFNDSVMKTVLDKYQDDPELAHKIFNTVSQLLENNNDDDDDTPVVDPCNVFNNRKGIEDYEEFEE